MNNDKRTLVILTPGFAKDESDSTCLPLQQQLVKALKESDPRLHIIILSFNYPFHTQTYTWFGTTIIPFNNKSRGLYKLLLRQKVNKVLKEIHKRTPLTGLLSFWYGECAAIGSKFANKHDLKHFCWILGQDAKKENKYPRRTQLPAGELIALSDFIQKEFKRNHGIKPKHLVAPGVDTTFFNNESEKDIDILAAGSLIPLKQYDVFVEVIAEIKKLIPGIKAMLIGKGPEKDRLEKLIVQLGLQSNITLIGELSYAGVIERMQRAKVFLHPSSYEGFGVVSIEALYARCHVISFTKPMQQEIEHWNIVSSKEEMIQKAIAILQNPLTIYKKVHFYFIDEVAKKMLALFLESK
jgi:glycosyltransferase involved in cell wall biosynthesis